MLRCSSPYIESSTISVWFGLARDPRRRVWGSGLGSSVIYPRPLYHHHHPPPRMHSHVLYSGAPGTVQEVKVGAIYRDVVACRSVTEILKQIFSVFFVVFRCWLLLLSAILLAVLVWFGVRFLFSFFSFYLVSFLLSFCCFCFFLPTCWPKSRVEKCTQRSIANEFPLLEGIGLSCCQLMFIMEKTSYNWRNIKINHLEELMLIKMEW